MKKLSKFLDSLDSWLIFATPVAVFFSYYPVIRLSATESMNLELSLPLILLFLLGLLSIRRLGIVWRRIGARKFLTSAIIPFYISLSILWSPNKLRGILVAGIVWLIWLVAVSVLFGRKLKSSEIRKLVKIYLRTAAVFALLCLIQCLLDVFGVARDYTLLCQGCTYQTFGFPHPNGLAIEPQFMGNLLLVPCIISIFIFFYNIKSHKCKREIWKSFGLTIFLIMVLYVVFSRGAIYSFVIAAAGMFIYFLTQKKSTKTLVIPGTILVAFGLALVFQGTLAAISPTAEGFSDGVARSINQMSLGIIDLRRPVAEEAIESGNNSTFDGYVEESTEIRLSLNEVAFKAWQKSPVFGVGIGGAGVAIHNIDNNYSAKEIVQNEYISILLELGVVGLALVVAGIIWLVYFEFKQQNMINLAAITAYLISLCFFSGLPNVLHIYLLMPMLGKSKDKYFMVKYENEQVNRRPSKKGSKI